MPSRKHIMDNDSSTMRFYLDKNLEQKTLKPRVYGYNEVPNLPIISFKKSCQKELRIRMYDVRMTRRWLKQPPKIIFSVQNYQINCHRNKSSNLLNSPLSMDDCPKPLDYAYGLRAKASPNLALLSTALVSTSPEMVKRDFGRHSCWIRAVAVPKLLTLALTVVKGSN